MSKKENAFGTNPDRIEDDPAFLDEPEGRSLSREMKIGVGVILLLVAVLGAVLFGRLRGSSDNAKPTGQDAAIAKSGGAAENKSESQAGTPASGNPVILAATGDTSAAPPVPQATSLWPAASDLTKAGPGSATGRPPIMPRVSSASSQYSPGYSSPPFGNGATNSRQADAGFTSVGDAPPRQSTGSSTASSNAINEVPDSLALPGSIGSPPSFSGAGPQASQPPAPGTGGNLPAATSGFYGSDYSSSSGHGRHAGSPSGGTSSDRSLSSGSAPGNSAYSNPSYSSSPSYGTSASGGPTYGRSPGRAVGGDRPSAQFGTSLSDAPPYSNSLRSDSPPSLQAPALTGPPPALRTTRGPASGRSLGRGNETYIVQPNDTYCTISKTLYGTDAYYRALAEHNRTKYPDANKLQVDDALSTPSMEELTAKYPDLCPKPEHVAAAASRSRFAGTSGRYGGGRTYTVQEGDNLFDIAKYELGKASRWVEIYELNRDALGTSFNYLTPGMRLALPEGRTGGSVTQRSEETSLR